MIARAIAMLSAATLYATINHLSESSLHVAKAQLEFSVGFWALGFRLILSPTVPDDEPDRETGPITINRVIIEVATTLTFWFALTVTILMIKGSIHANYPS